MRPPPRISVPAIAARLILDPGGAHELEVAAPHNIVAMRFSRDQVAQLESAIGRFKELIRFEEAQPGREPTRTKFIPLEVR